jgi:phosphoglycerol transferase MdoB-like AlkP superfamily enzyme
MLDIINFLIPAIVFTICWASSFSEPKEKWGEITWLKSSLFFLSVIHSVEYFFPSYHLYLIVIFCQIILFFGTLGAKSFKKPEMRILRIYFGISIILALHYR